MDFEYLIVSISALLGATLSMSCDNFGSITTNHYSNGIKTDISDNIMRMTTKKVLGKANMNWNLDKENLLTSAIELFTAEEIDILEQRRNEGLEVLSDVKFFMLADDATNPSTLTVFSINDGTQQTISINYGRDRTYLEFRNTTNMIFCGGRRADVS